MVKERPLTPLQDRFIRTGFEGFGDQEIVELLLSLCLPLRDCRSLAKKCLAEFQDLSGFLSASPQELERVEVTPVITFCITLLHELPAEILKKRIIDKPVYQSSREVYDYLYYSMRDLNREVLKAIYLSSRNQIIDTVTLFEGNLEGIPVRPREIVESAMKHNAVAVIFAHNHPSGDLEPSSEDLKINETLVKAGKILGIEVIDHIIITNGSFTSLKDRGDIK